MHNAFMLITHRLVDTSLGVIRFNVYGYRMDVQSKFRQFSDNNKHLAITGFLLSGLLILTFHIGMLGEIIFKQDQVSRDVITSLVISVLLTIVLLFESFRVFRFKEVAITKAVHKYLGPVGIVLLFVVGMTIFLDCAFSSLLPKKYAFQHSIASKYASMQSYIPYLILLPLAEFLCVRREAFSKGNDSNQNIIYTTLIQIRGFIREQFLKIIAVIALVVLLVQSIHFVPETHFAVKLTMGKVVRTSSNYDAEAVVYRPGLQFKVPFVQRYMDVSQIYNLYENIEINDELTVSVRGYFKIKDGKVWNVARTTSGQKVIAEQMMAAKLRVFLKENMASLAQIDEASAKELIEQFFAQPNIETDSPIFELPGPNTGLTVNIKNK